VNTLSEELPGKPEKKFSNITYIFIIYYNENTVDKIMYNSLIIAKKEQSFWMSSDVARFAWIPRCQSDRLL